MSTTGPQTRLSQNAGVEKSRTTGFRPMTPDGTPVIGGTAYDNLYLNTGHGTLGWTMACGSGQLIADIISARPTEIEVGDLDISRYAA